MSLHIIQYNCSHILCLTINFFEQYLHNFLRQIKESLTEAVQQHGKM